MEIKASLLSSLKIKQPKLMGEIKQEAFAEKGWMYVTQFEKFGQHFSMYYYTNMQESCLGEVQIQNFRRISNDLA